MRFQIWSQIFSFPHLQNRKDSCFLFNHMLGARPGIWAGATAVNIHCAIDDQPCLMILLLYLSCFITCLLLVCHSFTFISLFKKSSWHWTFMEVSLKVIWTTILLVFNNVLKTLAEKHYVYRSWKFFLWNVLVGRLSNVFGLGGVWPP